MAGFFNFFAFYILRSIVEAAGCELSAIIGFGAILIVIGFGLLGVFLCRFIEDNFEANPGSLAFCPAPVSFSPFPYSLLV